MEAPQVLQKGVHFRICGGHQLAFGFPKNASQALTIFSDDLASAKGAGFAVIDVHWSLRDMRETNASKHVVVVKSDPLSITPLPADANARAFSICSPPPSMT